jgi:NADPH-dependent curcumin reductase CurA
LAKTLYLSVDPYMRGRMREIKEKSYFTSFALDQPLEGGGVAQVVESKNADWKVGDIFSSYISWREYNVLSAAALSRATRLSKDSGFPLSTALGVLGMPGMTAYLGLMKIGTPKAGETLVVSGAAGAVGSLVGQIGKILGLRVIGIAGGPQKVQFLKELGFDVAIDYKATKDMTAAIAEAAPEGVDIYYDNVGGSISDAVTLNLNRFARVALCGAISGYNATDVELGPRMNWIYISRSVKLEGFIVSQWAADWPAGIRQMGEWIKEGKLKFHETLRHGIENTPHAFVEMLTGENTGKMIVHVADPQE